MKERHMLYAILLLVFIFRMLTFNQLWFVGSDSYYHYAFLDEFSKDFDKSFSLSFYPYAVPNSEPLGMYLILLPLSKIIGSYYTIKILPPIIGVLIVLSFYLFVKHYFGIKPAIYASSLMALTFSGIFRTISGNYRAEMFVLPLIFLSLISVGRRYTPSLIIGSSAIFWYGYPFVYLILILGYSSIIFHKFLNSKLEMEHIFELAISLVILKAFSFSAEFLRLIHVEHKFFEVYPLLFIIPVLSIFMKSIQNKAAKSMKAVISVLLVLLPILLIYALSPSSFQNIITGYGLVIPTELFHQTISELQRPNMNDLIANFLFALPLSFAGLYLYLTDFYRKNEKSTILLGYFILSIYLLFSARRFAFISSPAIFLLAAVSFDKITSKLNKKLTLALFAQIILIHTAFSYYLVDALSGDFLDPEWLTAANWIKENTNASDSFALWWDDASKIQALAKRPTIVDSVGGQSIPRITQLAEFFISSEPSDIGATYLLLTYSQLRQLEGMNKLLNKTTNEPLILGNVSVADVNGITALNFTSEGGYVIYYPLEPGFAIEYISGKEYVINRSIIYQNSVFREFTAPPINEYGIEGCFFMDEDGAFLFPEKICNSNFVKLFFFENLEGYSLVYDTTFIKIFKILK